uniref:Uncharacterized protein n=1 Tax=Meloidogyne incognita TaxID=6306 RepID=A0A914N0G9_MELIC
MITITQNFWLNNRNKTILMTNTCITCKNICILQKSQMRRFVRANVDDTTPFCKVTTALFVFSTTLRKIVQTFKRGTLNRCS